MFAFQISSAKVYKIEVMSTIHQMTLANIGQDCMNNILSYIESAPHKLSLRLLSKNINEICAPWLSAMYADYSLLRRHRITWKAYSSTHAYGLRMSLQIKLPVRKLLWDYKNYLEKANEPLEAVVIDCINVSRLVPLLMIYVKKDKKFRHVNDMI